MRFSQDTSMEKLGEIAGFILSYLLFATLLFVILAFLRKLPPGWGYLHILALTLLLTLLGLGIRRLLE